MHKIIFLTSKKNKKKKYVCLPYLKCSDSLPENTYFFYLALSFGKPQSILINTLPMSSMPPDKRGRFFINFLFLIPKYMLWVLKRTLSGRQFFRVQEPSLGDSSFEHPKHLLDYWFRKIVAMILLNFFPHLQLWCRKRQDILYLL